MRVVAGLFFTLPRFGIDGVIGLGIATSAAGWLNVLMLSSTLAREGTYRISARAWGRLMRLAIACGIMGAFAAACAMNYERLSHLLQRKEFVRAINTSAHGFNVAACVHYRRVFESVLSDAREAKATTEGLKDWPEFELMRTNERIAALRPYLPQFMVDHPHLYGILSKGVHELTEEECGDAMPALRQSIELMLQDKVDAVRREKRRQTASTLLAQTVDKHK